MLRSLKKLVLVAAACLMLAGCAGIPKVPMTRDPVLLLPEGAEVYAALYTTDNRQILDTIIESRFSEKQAAQVKKMVGYTDVVYAAIDTTDGNLTIVAQGEYPVSLISFALNGKNGWSKASRQIMGTPFSQKYYIHDSGIQVAFPSKNLCIMSLRSISDAIGTLYAPDEAADSPLQQVSAFYSRSFTHENSLALYSESPDKLVAALLGPRISFGIQSLGLKLAPAAESNSYTGLMELALVDKRARTPALFVLKALTLFSSGDDGYQVESVGEDGICLKNITISLDSMVKLFH